MDKNVNVVIIGLREILTEIRTQLKRLNWTKEDARRYLTITYGNSSLLSLSDEQLLEFVEFIAGLPKLAPIPYKQPSHLALKGLQAPKTNPLSFFKTSNNNGSQNNDSINRF
jgi:hypothetical protein